MLHGRSQKTTKRSIGLRRARRISDRRLVVQNRRLLCEPLEDRVLLSVGPIAAADVEALGGSLPGAGEVADFEGALAFTWTDPAALNTNAAGDLGEDHDAQVTTDSMGNWVAVWNSDEDLGGTIGTDRDILFSRSTDAGQTWTAPVALNTNAATDSGWDYNAQVTTDSAGNWVAVWFSGDSLGGTIGTDYDILFSRSTDAGQTWTAPAALNTTAATDSGKDYDPEVTTDSTDNWVAVWESSDSLGGTIGMDRDILFSRSTDAGQTWTAPAFLNTNATTDSGGDYDPEVTTDSMGDWVAVWYSYDSLGGPVGSDWDILFSRSTDAGQTWTAPAALNANAATDSGGDLHPQVTTDSMGNWVAVWHSDDGLRGKVGTDCDVLFSRSTDAGQTWTAPAALNTNARIDLGNEDHAQVSTDSMGNWVAVWDSYNYVGGVATEIDVFVSRSTDVGQTWTAPAALNTNAATDSWGGSNPQVTTDSAGNWVAVWWSDDSLGGTIGTDNDILVSRSTDAGQTWTAPAALDPNAATDSRRDNRPQITTDSVGNWVAVWESFGSLGGTVFPDNDILFSRSTDAGQTWTASTALNTNAATDLGEDFNPQVTMDSVGNCVAVWQSDDSLGGTIGTDEDILFSRSTDAGQTWTAPTALNTNGAIDSGTDQDPQVTTDSMGNWVAVWYSNDSLGGTIGTDWDILFSRSTDAGQTWTAPTALNTYAATNGDLDVDPQVTTDSVGNWVVVWESKHNLGGTIGTDNDILFSRSTDGGQTWTAPAALNTTATTDSGHDYGQHPQVTADSAGNWVAVWHSKETLGETIGRDRDILFSTVVNEPPEVSLDNTTTRLAENTLIANRRKVADIVVTDDGLGINTLSLSGVDASLFEIDGAVLYLKAGTPLDFETNPVLDVTVEVDDATVGGTPDDTADLAISVVPVLEGTADNDLFVFVAGPPGSWTVNLNGVPHHFGPEAKALIFDGLEGQDTAMIIGTDSDDTVELWPGRGRLTGKGYSLAIGNVETVTAVGGEGVDVAFLHDTPEAKDTLTGEPDTATLSGNGYSNQVTNFPYVHVYGTPGDGDEALFQGDPNTQDWFEAWPDLAKFYGDGYFLRAKSFADVRADGTPGGNDVALLHDDPEGIDTFDGGPDRAELSGDAFFLQANSFRYVHAYATAGFGDVATFHDDPARFDKLRAWPGAAKLWGELFFLHAKSFGSVYVNSTPGVGDQALLYDSITDDTFAAWPDRAEFSGDTFLTQVNSFRWVHAYSSEGDDVATLYGSDGRDVFVGKDRFGKLRGTDFYNRAVSFGHLHVYGRGAPRRDVANLYDAVLEAGVTQPVDMTQVAWLYEFERIRQKSDSGETIIDVVDQIFTAYWE